MKSFLLKHLFAAVLIVTTAIGASAQCNAPSVSVLGVFDDSVSLSWAAVSGATGYEYAILPSSASAPTSGTPVTATTLSKGQLSYSAYKAWVRTDCGGGNFSGWASITFNVTCSVPAISISNVTQTSADINWPRISNTATYEYVIDQSSLDPADTGTKTSANTLTLSTLNPANTYYAHFRTNCNSSTNSSWTIQSFITLFPASIGTVNANNSIYPNPVSDVLHLQLNTGISKAAISDMFGRTLYVVDLNEGKGEVNMQPLPQGWYFLRYTDGITTQAIKIQKQ